MTPREFRQEQEFKFDHFQELTSTGIKPNYVNIELFAHEYHRRKLKLLGIANVSTRTFRFSGMKDGEKFVKEIQAPDRESAIADFELTYPDLIWRFSTDIT